MIVGTRALRLLLGTWLLVALTPALIWVVAVLFDRVDEQLRDALAWSWYTIPFALGAAAVTLAMHGLMLNATVRDVVTEQFDEIREGMGAPRPVAAPAGAADAAPVEDDDAPTRTMKSARVAPPPTSRGERIRKRAKARARTELRRRTGF